MPDIAIRLARFFVPDHDGDVTTPETFKGTTGISVPVLPAHENRSHSLGRAWIRASGEYAKADVEFNQTRAAQDWLEAIRHDFHYGQSTGWGPRQEFSYAFRLLNHDDRYPLNGKSYRWLKDIDTVELSGVLRGSSIGSTTETAKSGGPVTTKTAAGYEIKGGGYVEEVTGIGYHTKELWRPQPQPPRRADVTDPTERALLARVQARDEAALYEQLLAQEQLQGMRARVFAMGR